MKTQYKREMEQFGPRQEELEKLYTLIEGGTDMKWKKWLGRQAVAIAVCAALTLTAAAAAAPAVWKNLQEHLGAFAPYAQNIKGAKYIDQGIEVQVLSAVSDELEARFYLAVRDVEADRLNEFLTLTGRLTAGEEKPKEGEISEGIVSGGWPSTSDFSLISYDPESKTALLSAEIGYYEGAQPNGQARLELTGMTTKQAYVCADIPCAPATGKTLKSLPVGKDDKVIGRSMSIINGEYTYVDLPSKKVVLAPGQNPMDIEGTEDMRISSMGFASDGCFHIRLEFAEGVKPAYFGEDRQSALMTSIYVEGIDADAQDIYMPYQQTLVEGDIDILFPLVKAENLETLQGGEMRLAGYYFRTGADIEGEWFTEFEMEYYPSTVLDWKGSVNGWQMQRVTLSPLSVTMTGYKSDSSGALANTPLYAVKKDGTEIAAKPGTGYYANRGGTGGVGWECYATWKFEEPVDLNEIVSLKLMDAMIPVK